MARHVPLLSVMALVLVALTAAGAARAQGESECDASLKEYPADMLEESWVRVDIQNQGPPVDVTMCIIERDGATNRAIHKALLPAADEYTHTFRLRPGEFVVHLRVFDPSGALTTGGAITANLNECLGVVWRPEITYVAGTLVIDQGAIDCEGTPPGTDSDGSASRQRGRLVALPWAPVLNFPTSTTGGAPLWTWAIVAAPAAFVIWQRHLLWFLFTRIARPDLLDQRHRARILDLVRADPGIHFEAIGRQLELANGAVRHHLGLLLRNRLLIEVRTHGKRCLFVPEAGARTLLEARAALTVPTARRVYDFLHRGPSLLEDVAQGVGISRRQARRWLHELSSCGLVEDRLVNRHKEFQVRKPSQGTID